MKIMGLNGLEPSTSRLSGVRSNQLSYRPILERVMGIEPTTSAWKAEVLPLNYTRIFLKNKWWRGTDSNRRTHRERIYSPPRLATSLPLQKRWLETESNCRHEDFQSSALPTELSSQKVKKKSILTVAKLLE